VRIVAVAAGVQSQHDTLRNTPDPDRARPGPDGAAAFVRDPACGSLHGRHRAAGTPPPAGRVTDTRQPDQLLGVRGRLGGIYDASVRSRHGEPVPSVRQGARHLPVITPLTHDQAAPAPTGASTA
jgi:hypothetical protein